MADITYTSDETPRTMYDKIWADHIVEESEDGTCVIFIDRHLVHEVSDYTCVASVYTDRGSSAPDDSDHGICNR